MKIFDTSSIVCIFREVQYPKILDACKGLGYRLSITPQVYEEIMENPETLQHLEAYGNVEILQDGDAECCKRLAKRYPWLHTQRGTQCPLCRSCHRAGQKAVLLRHR